MHVEFVFVDGIRVPIEIEGTNEQMLDLARQVLLSKAPQSVVGGDSSVTFMPDKILFIQIQENEAETEEDNANRLG